MAANEASDEPKSDILTEFKPFQASLEDKYVKPDGTYIDAPRRTIVHLMTHDGERGKSVYIKHLMAKHSALLIDYENPANVKCLIAGKAMWLDSLGRSAIIVIDIPRSVNLESNGLYTLVESVKDGHFMSGKYKPQTVKLAFTPHLLLCTNELLAVEHMSPDKFECNTLDDEDKLVLNPLMLAEQMRVANEQQERQQALLESIRTVTTDRMDRIFDGCFEVEEGNDEKWYVKLLHEILVEASPHARLPALGGPAALGIWLSKRFPAGHPAVGKQQNVNGKFYTGLKLKPAPAPAPALAA